jgi:hypothetical protein
MVLSRSVDLLAAVPLEDADPVLESVVAQNIAPGFAASERNIVQNPDAAAKAGL